MLLYKKNLIAFAFVFLLIGSIFPVAALSAEEVNDYSSDVANLIRNKCHGTCDNVVLLGDDYVIPSFRRDIKWLDWYILYSKIGIDKILTDIGYVQRRTKTFSEFEDLFVKRNWYGDMIKGKDVVFITPDYYDPELIEEIENLDFVLDTYGYATDVFYKNDSEVTCNDPVLWDNFNGKTIFVFGEDNTALSCFPFVSRLEDSAFIDINPWDGKNYAVIIQSDSKLVLQTFRNIIQSGGYVELYSEWLTFVETGVDILSLASVFVGADTIMDVLDTSFQCVIKRDKMGCGISGAAIVVPLGCSVMAKRIVKPMFNYFGSGAIGRIMLKYSDNLFDYVEIIIKKGDPDAFEFYLKKFDNQFADEIIEKTAKNMDDLIAASDGTEVILKKAGSNVEELSGTSIIKLADDDAPKTIQDIGKIKKANVQGTSGNLGRISSATSDPNAVKGAAAEFRRGAELAEDNVKKLHNSKNFKVSGSTGTNTFSEMEADWFYEKNGKRIAEEVKNVDELTRSKFMRNGVNQLDRYTALLESGQVDKVNIIVQEGIRIDPVIEQNIKDRGFEIIRRRLPNIK